MTFLSKRPAQPDPTPIFTLLRTHRGPKERKMELETYVRTLLDLLHHWMSMHVKKTGPRTYTVASNTHNADDAVEAIATRFPPPPYPPKWDLAIPFAVRVAARELLKQK